MKNSKGGFFMKVGVIMGGISSEREISLLTGNEIAKNLNKDKYQVTPVVVNNQYELIDKVKDLEFVFIALHGNFGEDGKVQAMLESINMPYSGSGVLSSALCMDKDMSKKIFMAEEISTPAWAMVKHADDIDYSTVEKFDYPLIVKPNSGGSSIGTIIVNNRDNVKQAVKEALKFDNEVMIEKYIKGQEITCCILNGKVLPTIAIRPKAEFFDYKCKYDEAATEETVVELPQNIKEKVEEVALKCWKNFKLKVYARVDMILKGEDIYVLEINTLPGMTRNSLFPKSAAAYGLNFTELLDTIIQYSLDQTE